MVLLWCCYGVASCYVLLGVAMVLLCVYYGVARCW